MTATVTWLAQAGMLVETGSTRVLVDPYFADHEARRFPSPPADPYIASVDALLVTHEHVDHLDRELLPVFAQASPGAKVVVPAPIADEVGAVVGAERVVGVAAGDELRLTGDVSVEVLPAWHGLTPAHGYTTGGGRFLGFIVATPSLRLYHAGDTIVTGELLERVRGARVDVAFLPVNGRDYFREGRDLVGNTNFREAVELARAMGATTLVPIHWDLFEGNTEWPGRVADEAVEVDADLHVVVLRRFKPFVFA